MINKEEANILIVDDIEDNSCLLYTSDAADE